MIERASQLVKSGVTWCHCWCRLFVPVQPWLKFRWDAPLVPCTISQAQPCSNPLTIALTILVCFPDLFACCFLPTPSLHPSNQYLNPPGSHHKRLSSNTTASPLTADEGQQASGTCPAVVAHYHTVLVAVVCTLISSLWVCWSHIYKTSACTLVL